MDLNRRSIAAIAAVVLTIAGLLAVVSYVNGANDRAYQGTQLRQVYQVKTAVSQGTKAEDLGADVEQVKLPVAAIATGAVTSLSDIAGLQANTNLEPGEQLLLSRFAEAGQSVSGGKTTVPDGMQEVTVALTSPRIVGQQLKVGDTVGVFASFDGATNIIENGVLITAISDSAGQATGDQVATRQITFAVETLNAEKIVNATEFGHIYLSKQNGKTDLAGSKKIVAKDILQ